MLDHRSSFLRSGVIRRHAIVGLLLGAGGTLLVPGCYKTEELVKPGIVPETSSQGRIQSDELGIDGRWYAYGDAYGDESIDGMGGAPDPGVNVPPSCQGVGKHHPSECSTITFPVNKVPHLGFENDGGRMCTHGEVAKLLGCCVAKGEPLDTCEAENTLNCDPLAKYDYSNIWGAGIGFDFDLDPTVKERDFQVIADRDPWDAAAHGVIGVSFELEWNGPELELEQERRIPLRVEFPVQTAFNVDLPSDKGTLVSDGEGGWDEIERGAPFVADSSSESHPRGSPFWRAAGNQWGPSPVRRGTNTIHWKDVRAPPQDPEYEPYLPEGDFSGENLLGIQFHVIPDDSGESKPFPYSFCISDLKFLTE